MAEKVPTFRVRARIYNNLLIEARLRRGFEKVSAAADAMGVSYVVLLTFENFTRSPISVLTGEWLKAAKRVAAFYQVLPEDLWPADALKVENSKLEVTFDMAPVLPDTRTPLELLEEAETSEEIKAALAVLKPRYRRVLETVFDLSEEAAVSQSALADEWGVTTDAVRQMATRALRDLRRQLSTNQRIKERKDKR